MILMMLGSTATWARSIKDPVVTGHQVPDLVLLNVTQGFKRAQQSPSPSGD
jgi:hypothetical protein